MGICRCLEVEGSQTKGRIFKLDTSKGLELFIDSDFAQSLQNTSKDHPKKYLSRTDFII